MLNTRLQGELFVEDCQTPICVSPYGDILLLEFVWLITCVLRNHNNEQGVFTPLVFASTGGLGREATTFYK